MWLVRKKKEELVEVVDSLKIHANIKHLVHVSLKGVLL